MMPCTQGSARDLQTQSDFCKALGLLAIHPPPMEEEPPVFAPTIGERVKRNLLLSNKVVSYKTYYRNKDVALKLKSNKKLNKKKNSARKSSRGNAPASSSNRPVEKQFLSPLTNLKSISHSKITNGFNQDTCRSLAQNLPCVNDFELSLEENHCQQVLSFYSPEKSTADSNLNLAKNYCNYSSPFKIKTCCVLLTKCPPICESVICELTSNGLLTNSLLEPMCDATVHSVTPGSESVLYVPSTNEILNKSLLEHTSDIIVKSAGSGSESVICVPSTEDLHEDSLLDDMAGVTSGNESVDNVPSTGDHLNESLLDPMSDASVKSVSSGSESVIHVPSTDDLPNKSLLKPTSGLTVKSALSGSESVLHVPSTGGLHKDSLLDVISGVSFHSVAHNGSKHMEAIPDDNNLATESFRQNFASPTEVESSLSYSYGEKESLNCTSPMNVSVESNAFDQLPVFSVEGCTDVKCNARDLLTLESGSSSPTNFTIQIETQDELEVQESLLSSAQESAIHISEVFSLASSTNSTCSSSSCPSSLRGVSSEESDDNSSLAMEEAFHLRRKASMTPYCEVKSSQLSPQVAHSIGTNKFPSLATTQYVNKKSSVHKLCSVVDTENRYGSGVNKIFSIIGNSVTTAVGTDHVTSGISDDLGDTPVVTSVDGNEFSGIGDNLEATPVVSSDVVSKISALADNIGDMLVVMSDDATEFSHGATPVVMSDVVNVFSSIGNDLHDTPVVRGDTASEFSGTSDNFGATPVVTGELENEFFNIEDDHEATTDVAGDVANEFPTIVDNCESIPGDFAYKFSGIIDTSEATPVVVGNIANEFSGIIENLSTSPSVTVVDPSRQSFTIKNYVNQSEPSPRGDNDTFPSFVHSQSMTSAAKTGTDALCEESSLVSNMQATSSSDILTECMPEALQEPSAIVLLHNNVGCEDRSSEANHIHLTPVQAVQTQTEESLSACHIPSDLVASTCSKVTGKHKPKGQNHYECDNCQCRFLDVMLLVKHLLMHHSYPNQSVKSVYKSQSVMCNNSEELQEQLGDDTIQTLHSISVPDSFGSTIKSSPIKKNSPRRSGRLVHLPISSNNRTEFAYNQEMSNNLRSQKNLKKRGISYLIDKNGYDDVFHDRSVHRTILENSKPNNTVEKEHLDYTANKQQKTKDTRKTIKKIHVSKSKKTKDTNTVGIKNYKANCNSQQTIDWNCSRTDSILICPSSSNPSKDLSTPKGINRTTNYPVAVTSYQTEVDNLHLQTWPSNSSAPVCADKSHEYTSPYNGIATLSVSSNNSTCTVSSSIRTKKSFTRLSGFASQDTGTSNMEQDGSFAAEFDLLSECEGSDLDFEGFSSSEVIMSCEFEGNGTNEKSALKSTDALSSKEHLPEDIAPTLGLQACPERYSSRTSDSTMTDLPISCTRAIQSDTFPTNMFTPINDMQSNATAKEPHHTVADLIPSFTTVSHNNISTKEMCSPSNNMQSEAPSTEIQHSSLLIENTRIVENCVTNDQQDLDVRNSAFHNRININTQCTITDHLVCGSDNVVTPVIILDDESKVDETTQQGPSRQVPPVVSSVNGLRANETTQKYPGSQVSPVIFLDDVPMADETTQQLASSSQTSLCLPLRATQQLASSSQTSLCLPLRATQCNEDLDSSSTQRRFSQDKPRLEVNDEAEVLFENTVLPKCEEKFLSSYYSYGSVNTMTSDLGTNLSVEEIDQLMKRCRPLTVVGKRHLVIIDGEKKFKCHECLHLVIDSLPLLRQHYSIIHGHGLKCIFCSQSFEQVGHLRLHLLNHGQVIKFKCTSCSAVFGRALDLQTHSHSCLFDAAPTLFKCHHCQSTFMSNSALQLHISTTHFQDKPFKCEYCSSTCQLRGECVDHMKQMHGYNGD